MEQHAQTETQGRQTQPTAPGETRDRERLASLVEASRAGDWPRAAREAVHLLGDIFDFFNSSPYRHDMVTTNFSARALTDEHLIEHLARQAEQPAEGAAGRVVLRALLQELLRRLLERV